MKGLKTLILESNASALAFFWSITLQLWLLNTTIPKLKLWTPKNFQS